MKGNGFDRKNKTTNRNAYAELTGLFIKEKVLHIRTMKVWSIPLINFIFLLRDGLLGRLGPEPVRSLGHGLSSNSTLRSLRLNHCHLREEAASLLSRVGNHKRTTPISTRKEMVLIGQIGQLIGKHMPN